MKKKKHKRMKKIVINGANGYVASHLINELLLQDFRVAALVRGNEEQRAADRMKQALTETYYAADVPAEKLEVYDYSLLDKDFALSPDSLKDIFSGTIDFFHFAASLKFKLNDKEEIFRINIKGLENSIETFLKYAGPKSRFFFVSTAYSCGKFSGIYKEQFYGNETIEGFRNYYEQSKRFAENTVKKYMKEKNLNAHVLRLSQVVGHNKSGVTVTDYGVFDFAKRIHGITSKYPHKKVRLQIDPDSTQNLIPIDNVVNYLMTIVKRDELPEIINIVGKNNMRNREIIDCICRLLPIEIIQEKQLDRDKLDPLERIIAAGMAFTGVYANLDLKFDNNNLKQVVSLNGNEVNPHSLYNMFDYFFRHSKGKK